jgi:hypothetical protein
LVVVAVFEDDETAQVFATAMNAIEGFQTFTVTSLVQKWGRDYTELVKC